MQKEIIGVVGMSCGSCVDSVSRELRAVPGVKNINVSLTLGSAAVEYDERSTSVDQLALAIERAGYSTMTASAAPKPSGGECCCS
jgi:copper chaperone CopZ